jgi:ATP-dependent helicase/nuclease subunit B
LRRDPYAIFAKRVLRLRPLDPIDADTEAMERGNLFHGILEDFVRAYPDTMPARAHHAFEEIARAHLTREALEPAAERLLRARLARMAERFLEWEAAHRHAARNLGVEVKGEIELILPGGPVKLTGRIDRIDADRASGALMIFDYKTGRTPSALQVETMQFEPQLPLGALLALKGGLPGIPASAIARLAYLRVGGGKREIEDPKFEPADTLIAEVERGLIDLLTSYDDVTTPYLSWKIPERLTDTGDYDLLARTGEWRSAGGDEE